MFNWQYLRTALVGNMPPVKNLRLSQDERLPDAGLTMGTMIIGRPGAGKTTLLANHIVDYAKRYEDQAIFVLDWSGSVTEIILMLILMEPENIREKLVKRVVFDDLGNPNYVIPMPEFSEQYGSYEEQTQRVSQNLIKLAPELVSNAPYLAGLGLSEIAPQIFRLLTATRNDYNECWQITEAKKLIVDKQLLKDVVKKSGYRVPDAKWFIEKVYSEMKESERELRTYAIIALLGAIEPLSAKARVGYYRPGWNPKDVIERGQIVLIDGARMINQKNTQYYLFTQAYSLIMAEINKRTPADPKDKPVSLVMDEVYSLLSIPGMAEEVGKISPLYRSRKLQLYVVLQSLSQLAKPLDEQIWSLGNKVVFAMENKSEAEKVAYQMCKYNPRSVKLPPVTDTQNPVSEPEHGQDRLIADWIQSFKFRECVISKYMSEKNRDKYIRYIPQTSDVRNAPLGEPLFDLKNRLLKSQGIAVRDALEVINQRVIVPEKTEPPKV